MNKCIGILKFTYQAVSCFQMQKTCWKLYFVQNIKIKELEFLDLSKIIIFISILKRFLIILIKFSLCLNNQT